MVDSSTILFLFFFIPLVIAIVLAIYDYFRFKHFISLNIIINNYFTIYSFLFFVIPFIIIMVIFVFIDELLSFKILKHSKYNERGKYYDSEYF